MAITKNVTVTLVDKPKAGDKYPRYTVHYTGDDGSTWKIGNLESNLKPETLAEIKGLTTPEEKSITVEKEGKFWNLISVGAVTEKKAGSTYNKPAAKSGGYDSLGNQIGNTITNAVVSLGSGKSITEYKARALELVLMGNEIRDIVESGTLVTAVQQPDTAPQDEVVKELGF